MKKVLGTDIQKAVDLLKAGKLVAIPTETVYGLAADANNEEAVRRIFEVKNRPIGHPLIVHIADSDQLSKWAIDIPKIAYDLTSHFWPGPLTLVLKRSPHVLDIVTGGQNTIALRSPSHPIMQEILQEFGGGLAAPSANRFGHVSPTCAEHVYSDLGDQVDFIMDGGPCEIGIESTILDLTSDPPRLLRPGGIEHEAIAEVIGHVVIIGGEEKLPEIPRVSGSLPLHYAPKTPTVLIPAPEIKRFVKEQSQSKKLGVLSRQTVPGQNINQQSVVWVTLSNQPKEFARGLYAALRELDAFNCDLMVIETVPENATWLAVWDRLTHMVK